MATFMFSASSDSSYNIMTGSLSEIYNNCRATELTDFIKSETVVQCNKKDDVM